MTIDLDAIEARANAATQGPWKCGRERDDVGLIVHANVYLSETVIAPPDSTYCPQRDSEFIAHSRTDIPALIAEVRRLRELTSVSMGVGSGRSDNRLVVHGDYESIRAAPAIVFEMERLRATVERVKGVLDTARDLMASASGWNLQTAAFIVGRLEAALRGASE